MARGNLWLFVYPAVAWADICCHFGPHTTLPAFIGGCTLATLIPSCTRAVQTTAKPTCLCWCTQSIQISPLSRKYWNLPKVLRYSCVCNANRHEHRLCGRQDSGASSNFCLADGLGYPFPSTPTVCPARPGRKKTGDSPETEEFADAFFLLSDEE